MRRSDCLSQNTRMDLDTLSVTGTHSSITESRPYKAFNQVPLGSRRFRAFFYVSKTSIKGCVNGYYHCPLGWGMLVLQVRYSKTDILASQTIPILSSNRLHHYAWKSLHFRSYLDRNHVFRTENSNEIWPIDYQSSSFMPGIQPMNEQLHRIHRSEVSPTFLRVTVFRVRFHELKFIIYTPFLDFQSRNLYKYRSHDF